MERLTRKDTIVVRGKEMASCNYENDECNDQCRYGTCRWQEKANILLKNYEDTGLSPKQVMELKEEILKIIDDEIMQIRDMTPDNGENETTHEVKKMHYLAEAKAIRARICSELN